VEDSKPLSDTNPAVPERALSSGSSTVLPPATETDIAEIRRSSMERPAGDYKDATLARRRMSLIPFLPRINVQMGSIVSGSLLTPTPEDPAGPVIVIGEPAEPSNENDSFYQGLSSTLSRITTKSSGSLYSQDRGA